MVHVGRPDTLGAPTGEAQSGDRDGTAGYASNDSEAEDVAEQRLELPPVSLPVLAAAIDPARLPAIVVSDGPRPVTLLRHGQVVTAVHPPRATVAEVTGAGDTLAGTFLAATERGLGDTDALQAAVRAATMAIRNPGISVTGT